jgi:hypothetical protein
MTAHDKIRLIGLLQESPATGGALPFEGPAGVRQPVVAARGTRGTPGDDWWPGEPGYGTGSGFRELPLPICVHASPISGTPVSRSVIHASACTSKGTAAWV